MIVHKICATPYLVQFRNSDIGEIEEWNNVSRLIVDILCATQYLL